MSDAVTISQKGAARARAGHPWIFRGDVTAAPKDLASGAEVRVVDARQNFIARAFWAVKTSPAVRPGRISASQARRASCAAWCSSTCRAVGSPTTTVLTPGLVGHTYRLGSPGDKDYVISIDVTDEGPGINTELDLVMDHGKDITLSLADAAALLERRAHR